MTSDRINTLKKYLPLYRELVSTDIKLRYRRSFLGYIWSVLNPLLVMSIMVFVFSHMFRFNIDNYPVYLIIGQTLWNFMNEATTRSEWSILGNANLLKKTYVPKYIFVLSTVSSVFVNMLFSLAAMVIVFIVCGIHVSWNLLFLPVILVQTFIFTTGMSFFLAQGCVFFQDIQYIYNAVLTAWMYATPIFYPFDQLPALLQTIVKWLNPMYSYITQFRVIALQGIFPDWKLIAIGMFWAFFFLLFGVYRFWHNQDRFILYI